MGRPKLVKPGNTDDQPTLPGTTVRRVVGPVERSIGQAMKHADHLDQVDSTAVALLRSAARNVDRCERNGDRHTHAMAVARMSELLTKLRLEPSARGQAGGEPDEWDRALASLGVPEGGDAPQP